MWEGLLSMSVCIVRLRYIIIIIIGDADASVDAGRRNLYMSQQQQQPTRIVLCTWPRGGDFCDHPRFYMNELPNSQFIIVVRRDQIFHVAARECPLSELA